MTIIMEAPGDIFESKMHTLVCPVNAIGAMGKGLAKQFKLRYPDYYLAYRRACLVDVVFRTEKCFVYDIDEDRKIYSLLTKWNWRYPSQFRWVDAALRQLAEDCERYGIRSLAIPAVGCGEGGLSWEQVRPAIHAYFAKHPVEVEIYEPFNTSPGIAHQ